MKVLLLAALGGVLMLPYVLLSAAPAFVFYTGNAEVNKLNGVFLRINDVQDELQFFSIESLNLCIDTSKVEISSDGRVISIHAKKDEKNLDYKWWLTDDKEPFCFCFEGFISIEENTLLRINQYINLRPEAPMLLFPDAGTANLNFAKLDFCFHELAHYNYLAIDDSMSYQISLLAYIVKKTWCKSSREELDDGTLAMGVWKLWHYYWGLYKEWGAVEGC